MMWTVAVIFALVPAAPLVVRLLPRAAGWVLALVPLTLAGWFALRLPAPRDGVALVQSWPWLPQLGLDLSLRLDGLSLFFALLICAVGALVLIYAGGYLGRHPRRGRLFAFLCLFMGAMLGLVLADNLLLLFVFWELTSISSYFLIGFNHEQEGARAAALQALLVTGLGGLALLAGILLLAEAGGSFSVTALLAAGGIQAHALYLPALLLILLGAFTKSAQAPFHFWLPNAMAAPTPVSAYLHSVTMVKAGVYLLLRLSPVLGYTAAWHGILEVAGGATMLLGAWLAVQQSDLKKILAYTTLSSLGILVFLIGLEAPLSIEAALVYLLAHALYKGCLFMVAGAVDHAAGTRDITRLGGLARQLPLLAVAAAMAGLSMAGAPLLAGFIGKELFYQAVLTAPGATLVSSIAAVVTSVLMVLAACLVVRPFFGKPGRQRQAPHPLTPGLVLGPLVLAGGGLAAGLMPWLAETYLLAPAVATVIGRPVALDLKLWHGFTQLVILSALTLLAGVALYPLQGRLRSLAGRWPGWGRWGPARGYDLGLAALNGLAVAQTRWLQNGRLRIYLVVIVSAGVALVAAVLIARAGLNLAPAAQPVLPRDLVLAAVILAAAGLAVRTGQRLTVIVAVGVIGYGVALIYAQFGAPDLAMTQFIIETMTVVLFAFIVHRLPLFSRMARRGWRLDALVALAAGALMTLLALVALTERHGSRLSGFFAAHSLPDGHGRNIVNVILVDFRALDTLGEITVLALAGTGVVALLKFGLKDKRQR